MTLSITPRNPENSKFAGEVNGIDIANGITEATAQAIEEAIDHYAVLVFPNQKIDDSQQFSFSSHFGPMEQATGDVVALDQRRLSMQVNDISNLDKDGNVLQRDDRTSCLGWVTCFGIQTVHSKRFQPDTPCYLPGFYQLQVAALSLRT